MKQETWQAVIVAVVSAVVGAIMAVVIATISGVFEASPGPAASLTVGGDVPQTFLVEGEAARIPDDRQLWLVVEGTDGSGSNPVQVNLATAASGDELVAWPSMELAIGGPDDAGKSFVIRAVLTWPGDELETGDTLSALSVRRISPPPVEPAVSIEITGVVKQELLVGGTATAIPDGHNVWLIVEHGDQWFPQGKAPLSLGPAAESPEGIAWERTVMVGQQNDAGKTFSILAVLTDRAGSDLIEAHLRENEFAGIPADDAIRDKTEILATSPVRRSAPVPPSTDPITSGADAPLAEPESLLPEAEQSQPDTVPINAVFTNVGSEVPHQFNASGAVSGLSSDSRAWVAVGFGDLLWLHGDPIGASAPDTALFAVPLVVGAQDESGTTFSLTVLSMTPQQANALTQWRDGSDGAGLPLDDPLLHGVDWVTTLTVTRR